VKYTKEEKAYIEAVAQKTQAKIHAARKRAQKAKR